MGDSSAVQLTSITTVWRPGRTGSGAVRCWNRLTSAQIISPNDRQPPQSLTRPIALGSHRRIAGPNPGLAVGQAHDLDLDRHRPERLGLQGATITTW